MSYDANSYAARKGKIGEQIVKALLENSGANVTRPDGKSWDEASLIDFHVTPKEGASFVEQLAEVKVRKTVDYAYGQAPCYMFPDVQIKSYINYAAERNLPLTLWIVDPDDGGMFVGELSENGLDRATTFDGRIFPIVSNTKSGDMRFYHQRQFYRYRLSEEEQKLFDDLDAERQSKPKQLGLFPVREDIPPTPAEKAVQPAATRSGKILRKVKAIPAPNGNEITLWKVDGNDELLMALKDLWRSVGYRDVLTPSRVTDTVYSEIEINLYYGVFNRWGFDKNLKIACVAAKHVPLILERYIKITFGGKQGSLKYQRNMAATALLEAIRKELDT